MANTKTPGKKPAGNSGAISPDQDAAKESSASQRNKEKLAADGSFIVLPDVKDIPGQENSTSAGVPGAMRDTTIASDDEEGIQDGKDLFAQEEDDDDVKIVMGTEADVTKEDLALLGDVDQDMDEDELADKEGLDDVDMEGDPLNEAAVDEASTGDDLDIPTDDDKKNKNMKDIGEEDEENDYYSLGSGDNDELNEGRKDE